MQNRPSVEEVEASDDYYHVRYRDPDDFETIRTPDWAEHAASSVCEGSEVRTGEEETGDEDWAIQSVLVPKDAVENSDEAAQVAQQIVDKIRD